jgi:hypothetical protein
MSIIPVRWSAFFNDVDVANACIFFSWHKKKKLGQILIGALHQT